MSGLKNIDLNLLKVFLTLMEEQNVSRAAEALSVSQPAVSGMLNRLRQNLNDPLFVRSQRGIVPPVLYDVSWTNWIPHCNRMILIPKRCQ